MAINKVEFGGNTLIDLTNDNISEDKVFDGTTFHGADGESKTGTMPNNGSISKTMDGIDTKSVNIPSGYTSGGTVSLDSTIDNEVDTQADLISQIKTVVDNLPEAGSSSEGGGESNTPTYGVAFIYSSYILHSATERNFLIPIVFEQGMTWQDFENSSLNVSIWCDSEYDGSVYYDLFDENFESSGSLRLLDVNMTDTIIDMQVYNSF